MAKRGRGRGGGTRPQQVGDQIRRAISAMLEDGSVKDPRLKGAALVTVTDVEMTPDLRQGRVFVSVFGGEAPDQVFEGLRSAENEIKRELARRLALRYTPSLQFFHDESIERGARFEALLKEVKAEDEKRPDEAPEPAEPDEGGPGPKE